jgi:4-oxalocrotonate tautomerase
MPIVTIQVTREGTKPGLNSLSAEEKAALIKGASELLLNVLNKPLESTFVIIEEVDTDNWGWGGLPALEYRRQQVAKTECRHRRPCTRCNPRRNRVGLFGAGHHPWCREIRGSDRAVDCHYTSDFAIV